MFILRDTTPIPSAASGCVIALGNFDGLHLGHRAVIEETLRQAKALGKAPALMTFEPHPRRVFRPDLTTLSIYKLRTRMQLLSEMGIEFLRMVRFTKAFSQMTARQFVQELLMETLHASHVVTGEDFHFGYKREGDAGALRNYAAQYGFGYTSCPAVLLDNMRCSSTHIRDLLGAGDIAQVARMLGRPYHITGRVQHGDERGRTIGFPTANIVPTGLVTPANGVYAVRAKLRGQVVNGVANLGMRPTFNGQGTRLEVHLFDWQEMMYGERMEVEFVTRLRAEHKFDGVNALKAQIAKDCEQARHILTQADS